MGVIGIAPAQAARPVSWSAVYSPLSWGMVFLLLFTMVQIGRLQEVIPALTPLRLGLIFGGGAAVFWLFDRGSLAEKVPVSIQQVRYVLMLLGLAVITVPIAVWPGNSFEYLTQSYWKTILIFLLVIYWCRTVQDLRRLSWVYCLGPIALVVFGLLFGSPSVESPGAYGTPTQRFYAGSGTYDPNDLALLLVTVLPLMLYLFSTSRSVLRAVLVGMMFVSLYAIVLTRSRGGFLTLMAMGVLIVLRTGLSRAHKILVVGVALLVFLGLAGGSYWDRMETMWNPQTEYDRTAGGRTELWKTSVKLMLTHPFGVGINGFNTAEGLSHGGTGEWKTAHNTFFQMGVELGFAGLFVYVLLLARTIKELRQVQGNLLATTEYLTPVPRTGAIRWHPSSILAGRDIAGKENRDALRNFAQLASMLEISLWGSVVGGLFLSNASPYLVVALSVGCIRAATSLVISSSSPSRSPVGIPTPLETSPTGRA